MLKQIFGDILERAVIEKKFPAKDKESRKWMQDQAKKVRKVDGNRFMADDPKRLVNRSQMAFGKRKDEDIVIGKMYMFFYDPKWKKELPYYDRWPLIFPLTKTQDGRGFYGINFHYLPHKMRAYLLDRLYDAAYNKRYSENTRMRMAYETLLTLKKYYAPCFKLYLNQHVRSRFLKINSTEWNIALFLPTERFEKATKQVVWKESMAKIAKGG